MGWIDKISDKINGLLDKTTKPAAKIDNTLLLCESKQRSGLSAMRLCSQIIKRLPEAGIPTSPNPDGSPNILNKFIRILSEEIVTEIKDNSVVDSVIQPGSVLVNATGANAGGPINATGFNTNLTNVRGIIR